MDSTKKSFFELKEKLIQLRKELQEKQLSYKVAQKKAECEMLNDTKVYVNCCQTVPYCLIESGTNLMTIKQKISLICFKMRRISNRSNRALKAL